MAKLLPQESAFGTRLRFFAMKKVANNLKVLLMIHATLNSQNVHRTGSDA